MSRKNLLRAGVRALAKSILLTAVFALGSAVGFYLYPQFIAEADSHAEVHEHDHGDEHEHESDPHLSERDEHHEHDEEVDHVALTAQAFANLKLRMGTVSRGDFWKTLLVPASVVEIPGRSDLSVSAPVTGIVEQVQVLAGQSLVTDAPLFSIRLTDQALIDAQSKLLETLTRQEVVNQEIARLVPLANSGAISGTKIRDLEYELKQLKGQQSTLLQELRNRGLPQSTVSELLDNRVLASTLSIYPPSFIEVEKDSTGASSGFSVENLMGHPGKSVSRGDLLCTVAYHSKLYIEGTAYPEDLAVLDRIAEMGWRVTVEQHPQTQHSAEELHLELLRVDNHVDEETQTVRFYLELPNEVTRTRQADGRLFEQWRFRPGQRLHLRLPVEHWENQLTLPLEAVVVEGPNVLVFAEHHDVMAEHQRNIEQSQRAELPRKVGSENAEMFPGQHGEHDDRDTFMELEPIPVRLLHRDDKKVVIADDGQISSGQLVALNNAYKLYLEMKMQDGGGGAHDHDH